MLNLSWAVPSSIPSLISQCRAIPLFRQPKKLRFLCIHALLWSVWKERNGGLFEDVWISLPFGIPFCILLLVGKTSCTFSCFPFDMFTCILGALLFPLETTPNPSFSPFFIFNNSSIDKKKKKEKKSHRWFMVILLCKVQSPVDTSLRLGFLFWSSVTQCHIKLPQFY